MGILSKLFGKKNAQSPAGAGTQTKSQPQPPKPTFYVFGLQGPAFSAGAAQAGDIMPEKAQKLKDEYAPAADMELKLIRPNQWGGRLNVSMPMNGLIQTTIDIEDHLPAIRAYLSKNGVKAQAIDKAIAIAKEEQLLLNNPFSGVVVIGIPVE